MADKVQCSTHGERLKTYVCVHLAGGSAGLGFNRDEPSAEKPHPDAWCDDCELIRAAHGGWNDDSEKLIKITMLCSGCYERARIQNTRTSRTLDELTGLRWKCSSCEEWHTGPCLDFSQNSPYYWNDELEKENNRAKLFPNWTRESQETFLDEDYCAINGTDYFARGIIYLPIFGTAETLRWGVWGSLSKDNFYELLKRDDDPHRIELPRMFSWLSTQLSEYPDTLSLKMYAHIQKPGERPSFEREESEHPLSQEFHHGILPERVKEIMLKQLRDAR